MQEHWREGEDEDKIERQSQNRFIAFSVTCKRNKKDLFKMRHFSVQQTIIISNIYY